MPLPKSWVDSANSADCPFPLNNLPYGVFSSKALDARCGIAIGDMILDVKTAEIEGLLKVSDTAVFVEASWNAIMALGTPALEELRKALTDLLVEGSDKQVALTNLLTPIGYNGRSSSAVASGTDVRRPWGQRKGANDDLPRFAPSQRFDFELEMGSIVGSSNDDPITVPEADDNIFGYVLLNDWSARDIQAKSFRASMIHTSAADTVYGL